MAVPLLAAAACGGSRTCTAIGCVPRVTVAVEAVPSDTGGAAPDAARLCVGERCAEERLATNQPTTVVLEAEPPRGSVAVTLTFLSGGAPVATRSGRLRTTVSRPNGEGCDPACSSARGAYRGGATVEPLP